MEQKKTFDLQSLLTKAKEWLASLSSGKNNKDANKLLLSFGIKRGAYIHALIVLGVVGVLFGTVVGAIFMRINRLNKQLPQLQELNHYELNSFMTNELMADEKDQLPHSISEMIGLYDTTKLSKDRIENELNFKKSVYNDFLRNLLLPSLNIWKNPYTQEIDLSILGKKYLDNNPYQDISLLGQWSAIIRDSGKDIGTNEVVNMQIGDIEEEENGFFRIPISIAFKSDSKRAFLLLVDKLSLTSNINNIGLFSDFTYHLFEAIRANKQEILDQIAQEYQVEKSSYSDERMFYNTIIAHYLYSLIQNQEAENRLVDNTLIHQVIKDTVLCSAEESEEQCYFRFRDKYRTIP